MSTEKDPGLGEVDLGWLKWRGVWLPTLLIGALILAEGILENYPSGGWKAHILSSHSLMIGIVAVGTYLFSSWTFALVRRGQEEILRTSERIAAVERRFRAMIEQSTDLVALLDGDGTVRYASPSFTRTLGYAPHETVGRNVLDLIVPYDHDSLRNLFYESHRKPGPVLTQSCRMYHKNGDWHWVAVSLTNLLTDPDVGAIVWNAHDVTEWRKTDDTLRSLMEGIPIGLYRSTAAGQLLDANPALAQMLGYPNRQALLTANVLDFYVDADDRTRWQTLMTRDGIVQDFEFQARRRDGTILWLKDTARVVRDEHKGTTCYEGAVEDVTERRQMEEARRKLSRAIEQAAESIFITDRHGVIEYVNPAFTAMTGFAHSEVLGKRVTILRSGVHDFYEDFKSTLMSGKAFRGVFTNRRKDGQIYLVEEIVSPILDAEGTVTHVVSTGRDVTQRDRAETEVRRSREQLRALAAHLESIREEEQKRIAREIHDGLGHMLTAMKYDLAWLEPRLPEASMSLRDKLREVTSLTDATIATVRRIASELRPKLLDDLGLEAAADWLTQDFQSRTGVRCELDSRLGDRALDPALSTAVFRILQEALTNVARHAQATGVRVQMHRDDTGGLVLVVQDDGKGIAEDEITATQTLGLLGMRERALGCGGTVAISGTAGAGTTVVARFPVRDSGDPSGMRSPAHAAPAREDAT